MFKMKLTLTLFKWEISIDINFDGQISILCRYLNQCYILASSLSLLILLLVSEIGIVGEEKNVLWHTHPSAVLSLSLSLFLSLSLSLHLSLSLSLPASLTLSLPLSLSLTLFPYILFPTLK